MYRFSIAGMTNDPSIQECSGPFRKKTFPDLDYVTLGYNIFRGYPLAIGHDPGFTHPIFVTDYRDMGMTSDCRYSLPVGFTAMPDVSCVTSFSSDEVKTTKEFEQSLSTSAEVSGGGWGVSFSASAGYKQASSEMSSANSVFVISKATCNYYFVKMDIVKPPKLHPGFLEWSARVATSNDEEEVLRFLDYYGTHYAPEVVFGARYIYKHVMSSNDYKTMSSSGTSVGVRASYSGLFSVGGGFNLDSSQREAATEFSKKVRTTTITVGAPPPANGDAMTWASTVKDFPVPAKYVLKSLDQLFSDTFIQGIRGRQEMPFNHTKVAEKIRHALRAGNDKSYCMYLKNNKEVDSCENPVEEIEMKKIYLSPFSNRRRGTLETCKDACMKESSCVGISYGTRANDDAPCYLVGRTLVSLVDNEEMDSFIFTSKLRTTRTNLTVLNADVTGRNSRNATKVEDIDKCQELCHLDIQCDLFWFCRNRDPNCQDRINCELYALSGKTREHLSLKGSTDFYEPVVGFVTRGD